MLSTCDGRQEQRVIEILEQVSRAEREAVLQPLPSSALKRREHLFFRRVRTRKSQNVCSAPGLVGVKHARSREVQPILPAGTGA